MIYSFFTDNWLLERCTDTEEEGTTDNNYSSSRTSNNNNSNTDSYAFSGTRTVGVRVKLIDFGRSLSVTQHSSHNANTIGKSSIANKGTNIHINTNTSAQLATLTTLYQPVVTDTSTTATAISTTAAVNMDSKPVVVLYEGDISAKGYKCREMDQNQPWSYQVCNLNYLWYKFVFLHFMYIVLRSMIVV